MKIQLECTLGTCSPKLPCIACQRTFEVGRIRTLLCNDQGLIYGDVCPDCLESKAIGIQHKLKQRAVQQMSKYRKGECQHSIRAYRSALELLELAEAPLKLPSFWQWLLKKLEVLSQETQELENARLGLSKCECRSDLHIRFQDEETS